MVTGEQRPQRPQRPHPATATEAQTHAAADGVLRGRSVFEAGGDDGDLQIEVNHLVYIHTFRTGKCMKMSHRNVEHILEHIIYS